MQYEQRCVPLIPNDSFRDSNRTQKARCFQFPVFIDVDVRTGKAFVLGQFSSPTGSSEYRDRRVQTELVPFVNSCRTAARCDTFLQLRCLAN